MIFRSLETISDLLFVFHWLQRTGALVKGHVLQVLASWTDVG